MMLKTTPEQRADLRHRCTTDGIVPFDHEVLALLDDVETLLGVLRFAITERPCDECEGRGVDEWCGECEGTGLEYPWASEVRDRFRALLTPEEPGEG